MSTLGYILGGAAKGLGRTLQEKGQAQAAAAATELEERRFAARAAAKAQYELEQQNNAAKLSRESDTFRSELKRKETEAEYGLRDRNDARGTARKVNADITVDSARTKNDVALEKVKSRLNLTEAQQKSALDLSARLAAARQEVGEFKVTKDGSMVAYSKTGQALGQTKKGIFETKAEEPVGLGGGLGAARSQPAPSAPQAEAAPAARPKLSPVTQVKPLPPAAVSRLVEQAIAEAGSGVPKWRGMNRPQIEAEVKRVLREQGYKF
jgi:hypothetical protein